MAIYFNTRIKAKNEVEGNLEALQKIIISTRELSVFKGNTQLAHQCIRDNVNDQFYDNRKEAQDRSNHPFLTYAIFEINENKNSLITKLINFYDNNYQLNARNTLDISPVIEIDKVTTEVNRSYITNELLKPAKEKVSLKSVINFFQKITGKSVSEDNHFDEPGDNFKNKP